jgi:hypothetical protein
MTKYSISLVIIFHHYRRGWGLQNFRLVNVDNSLSCSKDKMVLWWWTKQSKKVLAVAYFAFNRQFSFHSHAKTQGRGNKAESAESIADGIGQYCLSAPSR